MAENAAPFRSIAPSQPIPVYLAYGVFETIIVPAGVTPDTYTVSDN